MGKPSKLTERQQAIMDYLKKHKKATARELAKAVFDEEIASYPLTTRYQSLMRTIRDLEARGLIKKVTPDIQYVITS